MINIYITVTRVTQPMAHLHGGATTFAQPHSAMILYELHNYAIVFFLNCYLYHCRRKASLLFIVYYNDVLHRSFSPTDDYIFQKS